MYRTLNQCVTALEKKGLLFRIKTQVDPELEIAEIHRRVFSAGGPALLFENLKGCKFPAVSNIYGTKERIHFLFEESMVLIKALGNLRGDPSLILKKMSTYLPAAWQARYALPRKSYFSDLVHQTCQISDLPAIRSWPMDGGPFVLLPQVLSLPPDTMDLMQSNIGMYRIQLSGNEYEVNKEVGLHYQLHRGIGVHHSLYLNSPSPFKVSVFIGGPPAHTLAAIFPLPEGLSELSFAGLLNKKRFNYTIHQGYVISDQADFVITGTVDKNLKKTEGPFGDHLGYYSLQHPFPVLKVDQVYHRKNAIWHFTVVGRPPQEDSYFGYLIHELVKGLLPKEFPGLKAMHAVDVAGVHPLLLAIGQERYMPFRDRKPEEILTIGQRILGSGQTSLAKYLIIVAPEKNETIDLYNFSAFFEYVLKRVRWESDLHFMTRTTIDTLDYSGQGWNSGSKLLMACCGPPVRSLIHQIPERFPLPPGAKNVKLFQPGILCIQAAKFTTYPEQINSMDQWLEAVTSCDLSGIALIVWCDDAGFTTADWPNFLWVTFTRSNPSHDVFGVGQFIEFKHWGCQGPLVIDARIKPHHAPVLEPDQATVIKVDKMFSKGGPLYELNKDRQY